MGYRQHRAYRLSNQRGTAAYCEITGKIEGGGHGNVICVYLLATNNRGLKDTGYSSSECSQCALSRPQEGESVAFRVDQRIQKKMVLRRQKPQIKAKGSCQGTGACFLLVPLHMFVLLLSSGDTFCQSGLRKNGSVESNLIKSVAPHLTWSKVSCAFTQKALFDLL